MAKSLLDSILDSIFDEKWVGKRGEKLTEKELRWVTLLGRKGKTLRNVYIPKDNGETSEIDVLFITQKGIFVFESKNYSGWIFGDENSQYWTVMLPNRQKNRFYNPIRQNKTHMNWLQKYIGESVPLFSVIVFSERCELKKVELKSADIRVIKRDKTYSTVQDIWDASPDVLSSGDIDSLHEKLKALTKVNKEVKAAHIQDIRRKYSEYGRKNTEETESQPCAVPEPEANPSAEECELREAEAAVPVEEERICPRCGKPLILRTAKRGNNAGKQFYGCTGYPNCKYTLDLQHK